MISGHSPAWISRSYLKPCWLVRGFSPQVCDGWLPSFKKAASGKQIRQLHTISHHLQRHGLQCIIVQTTLVKHLSEPLWTTQHDKKGRKSSNKLCLPADFLPWCSTVCKHPRSEVEMWMVLPLATPNYGKIVDVQISISWTTNKSVLLSLSLHLDCWNRKCVWSQKNSWSSVKWMAVKVPHNTRQRFLTCSSCGIYLSILFAFQQYLAHQNTIGQPGVRQNYLSCFLNQTVIPSGTRTILNSTLSCMVTPKKLVNLFCFYRNHPHIYTSTNDNTCIFTLWSFSDLALFHV